MGERRMSMASEKLLLFGATGDLSQRMLLPSLFGLDVDGLLPPNLAIVATARSELDDAGFREKAAAALKRYVPAERMSDEALSTFIQRLRYVAVDASNSADFAALAEVVGSTEK